MTGPDAPSLDTQPEEGLLDTSAVIRLGEITDPALLPKRPRIAAITLAELSLGPLLAAEDRERALRLNHVQYAERNFEPLPFDAGAARALARVAADIRGRGRKPTARTFDALIAATAVANSLPLYTANSNDFKGISDLTVVRLPPGSAPPR